MMHFEDFGKNPINDRALFVLDLDKPENLADFSIPTKHFACLIAWDSEAVHEDVILDLMRRLVEAGAGYICCWGEGCERMHDLADVIDHETNVIPQTGGLVMTTWHSDEVLSDAIWFLLYNTWPDKCFEETLGSTIAIGIGNASYAAEMRSAFNNLESFSKKGLENGESAL